MVIDDMKELDYTMKILEGDIPPIPQHTHMKTDLWTFSAWKKDEVQFSPNKIIYEIEALERELHGDLTNNKHTCPRPVFFENKANIITLAGLNESADRDIGDSSTQLQYIGLGKNTTVTAATEGNVDLDDEFTDTNYARQDTSASDGQREVINQTTKFGLEFDDTDFDATVTIREAGLFWHLSDLLKMHSRVIVTNFTLSSGLLFAIQINELQANG